MEKKVKEYATDERRLRWMWRVRQVLRRLLRFEVIGQQLPLEPVLIVSNHRSLLDALYMFAATDCDIVFVATAGVFKIPFLGRLLEWMGCIKAYRHKHRTPERRAETLREVQTAIVHRRRTVCLYPEGGIVKRRQQVAHKITHGVIDLHAAGCVVVPIVLVGARHSLFRPWRPVEVTVYPPLPTNLDGETIQRELSEQFRNT